MKSYRTSVIFLLLILPAFFYTPEAYSQSKVPAKTAEFETVRNVIGTRGELWPKLKLWVALNFDTSEVIDMENPESGTMVIKWSAPVNSPSALFDVAVGSTYLISLKDGKYRFRSLQPKVILQLRNIPDAESLSAEEINRLNADLRFARSVANNYYEGSMTWALDDNFAALEAGMLQQLENTPKFRNDRDKERNKISEEWSSTERQWNFLHSMSAAYNKITSQMARSLNESLLAEDDF